MKYLIVTGLLLLSAPLSGEVHAEVNKNVSESVIANDLFEAIRNIDIISLNVLLAEGADIDSTDREGNTPLMIASKIGNIRMMNIILAHNPDVNKRNNEDVTALMIASEQGQYYVAEMLISRGADIYAKNSAGLTAAEIAYRNGHSRINSILQKNSESQPYTR